METNGNDVVNKNFRSVKDTEKSNKGLTKREYFAALAMQGLLTNAEMKTSVYSVTERSVAIADVLIEQLNKKHE